ncbi:putative e3 ubiquitin-protein ligase xbat35 [Quercus suber]|uniref:E3 ubiquitin-protein ligase xbat35 n=1 Tax=Quercus suber TaxID=58331 RepID=A0AAW0KXS3_QUESU
MADTTTSTAPSSSSTSTSSSVAAISRDTSGDAASSSNSSQLRENEDQTQNEHQHRFRDHEIERQQVGHVPYHRGDLSGFDDSSTVIRDDTWSCVIVLLTFWFFGPGPVLYGFYKAPVLDTVTTWSETRNATVPEWAYLLNAGSQINISYSVVSPGSSVFLIIAEGNDGLSQWLEDPTYPNTTLSWNLISGSGMITQDIYVSSSYYVAVGNLNTEEVEVQLNLRVKAYLYNTTEAYYKCTFADGMCGLNVLFPNGNAAVLTSPSAEQGKTSDELYVRLSYGPRWVTYIVGIGGMTVLMLFAFNYLNKFQCVREEGRYVPYGEIGSERAPLLSYKDDDLSSWGSSYDSISHDEDDIEDFLALASLEGKSQGDGETSNNTRRLCAICFDAPRDCFFLPCGHCVACFECATRIAEAAGTCPVCRRTMKKVRKIFTV